MEDKALKPSETTSAAVQHGSEPGQVSEDMAQVSFQDDYSVEQDMTANDTDSADKDPPALNNDDDSLRRRKTPVPKPCIFPMMPPTQAFVFSSLSTSLNSRQKFSLATLALLTLEETKLQHWKDVHFADDKADIEALRRKQWVDWVESMKGWIVEMLQLSKEERQRLQVLANARTSIDQAVLLLLEASEAGDPAEKLMSAHMKADTSTKDPKSLKIPSVGAQSLGGNGKETNSSSEEQESASEVIAHVPDMNLRYHIITKFILHQIAINKSYPSQARTFMRHLCLHLNLPESPTLPYLEAQVSLQMRLGAADEKGKLKEYNFIQKAKEAEEKGKDQDSLLRWAKIGAAAVGGGALIGITGGLAAPAVAAALTGWGVSSMIASSTLITTVFAGYGAKTAADKMSKRIADIKDFAIRNIHVQDQLSVTLCISGWLSTLSDVTAPWQALQANPALGDVFALQWETETQLALGQGFERFLTGKVIGYAKSEIIKRTVFASLWSALWPLGMLKYGYFIDNPFHVACARAEKTGKVLAEFILSKPQGERPLTLIGYSLGARVIYYALRELASRPEGCGLVENAILLGAPITPSQDDWRFVKSVVSGRLVNGYSRNDWTLGFMYRAVSVRIGVRIAGLESTEVEFDDSASDAQDSKDRLDLLEKGQGATDEAQEEPRAQEIEAAKQQMQQKTTRTQSAAHVENIDLSDIIGGHTEYAHKIMQVLEKVNIDLPE